MIETQVLHYFEQHAPLPGSPDEQLDCYYLNVGAVDSLGIVSLIAALEEQFAIRFTAEDLQSEEFQTPRGIAALIRRAQAAAAAPAVPAAAAA